MGKQSIAATQVGRQPVTSTPSPEPKRSDFDVEAAIERGEHARAMTLLVERHAESLYRFCYPRCGAAATDVVQTTFEQVWRDIASYERQSQATIRAWLFRIAFHRCMDHLRSEKTRRAESLDEVEEIAAASTDTWCGEPGRQYSVRELLNELPPHVGFAIALRYLEGFSFQEMATICGEQPATLERRVARGIAQLQKRLIDLGVSV
jgi:RNA polymerase sigma-70 factor (ECF subfamily)